MSDDLSLQWSDIWLLQSIVLCGRNQRGLLKDIVGTGDYLNHSIFTYEEMSGGLYRLTKAGLVTEADQYFMATNEASRAYETEESHGGSIYDLRAGLAKHFEVERPTENFQKLNRRYEYPGISPEAFAAAVRGWDEEAAAILQKLRAT